MKASASASSASRLSFSARIAARNFDVSLTIEPGETVAILGPNGAGKSTLLGVIAGLVRPDSGQATLSERTIFSLGGSSSRQSWTPAHSRGVSLLAQDALLFPHLTAAANVAFGPRSAGASRGSSLATAAHWLSEVDAAELGDRKPAELSGGQAQRIAVARALASDPDLLLLDEPMAALDVTVAPNLRRLLRRVLADRTAIIVTHEVLDAYTLADRVVVVNDGHIVEQGPTREVLDRPRTRFTADLAALNLLTGTRTGSGIVMSTGASVAAVAYSDSGMGLVDGVAAAVAVRPSAVSIGVSRPSESGLNVFSGVVTDIEPRGDVVRVRIDGLAADVSPAIVADLDLAPGSPAVMSFAAADAVAYAL